MSDSILQYAGQEYHCDSLTTQPEGAVDSTSVTTELSKVLAGAWVQSYPVATDTPISSVDQLLDASGKQAAFCMSGKSAINPVP